MRSFSQPLFSRAPRSARPRSARPRSTRRAKQCVATAVATLLVGAVARPLLPSATASDTYTPSASIDRTGARDVTAELQKFLTSVPHHSKIVFPKNAKYRIEGTLQLARRNDMVVDGNGATFFATQPTTNRKRSQWIVSDISGLVFTNMTIRGAHRNGGTSNGAYVEALEAQHGLEIRGGDSIEVANLRISDVYGDFIYIAGSLPPAHASPENIYIHDSVFRRNGRQGVAVVQADNVVIANNDIADTRRATFDLEPNGANSWVRGVFIVNNRVGSGRLKFVAGHGLGDVSNIYIVGNELRGKHLSIDMAAPEGVRRSNVVVTANRTTTAAGTPFETVMRFINYDGVTVTDNVQPMNKGRDMSIAGVRNSCDVDVHGNDVGQYGVGQLVVFEASYPCPVRPPDDDEEPDPVFTGDVLAIDVGATSTPVKGAVACGSKTTCPFIVRGKADAFLSGPIENLKTPDEAFRTMIIGNPRFEIPIRGGVYKVRLSFVEPTAKKGRERRFQVGIEGRRRLSGYDVFATAGGKNRRNDQEFVVTVGDGALTIVLESDAAQAVLSYILIERR